MGDDLGRKTVVFVADRWRVHAAASRSSDPVSLADHELVMFSPAPPPVWQLVNSQDSVEIAGPARLTVNNNIAARDAAAEGFRAIALLSGRAAAARRRAGRTSARMGADAGACSCRLSFEPLSLTEGSRVCRPSTCKHAEIVNPKYAGTLRGASSAASLPHSLVNGGAWVKLEQVGDIIVRNMLVHVRRNWIAR
jgi:hypothetical protein